MASSAADIMEEDTKLTSNNEHEASITKEEQETMTSSPPDGVTFDEADGNATAAAAAGVLYGTIRFKRQTSHRRVSNYYRRREFAIIDEDADRTYTTHQLANIWQLDDPKLVISLVGGYRGIKHVSTRVRKTFLRQLANAVLSTGAWLTTGGLHSGMTKDVGEALRDYAIGRALAEHKKVVAIGITPISVLAHKDQLSQFNNEVSITIDSNQLPSEHGNNQLDPNHSHYLLINDDGSDHTGVKIEAQSSFLKAIAVKRMEGSKSGIPVVSIIVGGGHRRIKAIYETVVENKIPVIVLDGSGGAADVIAFAYRELSAKDTNKNGSLSVKTCNELKARLSSAFVDSEKIKSCHVDLVRWCRKIAERRSLVTVLPLNEDEESHSADIGTNLEENILKTLLKAKNQGTLNVPGQYADQLHLATVLNRLDLAQQLLHFERTIKVGHVRQSLRAALVNDQVEFVRLFLNKGLNLDEYLSQTELVSLYRTIKSDTLFHELLSDRLEETGRHSVKTSVILTDVGNVINDLTTWSFKPLYMNDKFTDDRDRFHHPSRELFLWAVLQGRLEMALLFWEENKAPIGGALVAGKLLKEMAKREMYLHETRRLTRYEEGGRLFDKLAVEVLSEYYHSDRKLTSLTLVRKLHTWGSAICLDLANTAKNMEFIAHPAVQNMLKEFWMGNLSVSNARWKIWICLAFPPALLFIRLKLKEEESDPLVVKRLPRGRNTGDIKFRRPHLLRTFSIRRSILSVLPGLPHQRNDQTNGYSGPNFTGLPLREMIRRKRVRVDENEQAKHRAPIRRRIATFFFVPLVIFLYNVFSKVAFVALYSYILLRGFETRYPAIIEYVLIGWFSTLCLELIRQIIWEVGPTFWYRLGIWTSYFWNKVDICKTIVFITGYVLRCFPKTMPEGRILLAIGLIVFYIRLLHVCSANKHLGPKLVMIQGMFADLLVFVSILLVFLTAYGVAREAILYPGRAGVSSVLESIFYRPYLQIFGELLETNEDECYTYTREIGNGTHTRMEQTCQQDAWFGVILLSIYLFLSNVLLLNLLIAMFNFTFVSVQEKTDIHWKWQRFQLITEYHKRPALAPPFIIISHVILLVAGFCKRLRKMCQNCCCKGCDKLACKRPESDTTIDELAIWESVKGEDYLARKRDKEQENTNRKLHSNENRLVEISTHVAKIEQQVNEEMTALGEQLQTMQTLLEATVKQLQSQKESQDEDELKQIANAIKLQNQASNASTEEEYL